MVREGEGEGEGEGEVKGGMTEEEREREAIKLVEMMKKLNESVPLITMTTTAFAL